jgi:hypothetical protein
MIKCGATVLLLWLLLGCGGRAGRMQQAENPQGRYRDQIAAARRLLAQEADWSDRADWEVEKTAEGWNVTAWRVEHPDRQGPGRYVPWGYAVIELDSRMVAVRFRPKG